VPIRGRDEIAEVGAAFNAMAAELAAARVAEREFLMSVSHELRTPLTAVRGYAEALADDAVAPAEAATVIGAEAARLERLVDDLLDLARLDRRAFTVAREPVDLAAVARSAHERASATAADRGLLLELDAPDTAWGMGDPDRLLQALSNLVDNALRITPRGGDVTIRARPGELTVLDTGPGLSPETSPAPSTASTSMRVAAPHRAAPAWASRWCASSPARWAARQRRPTGGAAALCSACGSRALGRRPPPRRRPPDHAERAPRSGQVANRRRVALAARWTRG
jgi:hypothetical protein